MTWQTFVNTVSQTNIEFPELKVICLAQAMLASQCGTTEASQKYNNYHGIQWQPEMVDVAVPVHYQMVAGPTQGGDFCQFASEEMAIRGYWRCLDRPTYNGWRNHTNSPSDFLAFIGPIWCPSGYTDEWKYQHRGLSYHDYIMQDLLKDAHQLLSKVTAPILVTPSHELCEGSCGPWVQTLQRELNEHNGANLDVDGIFGSKTKQAVMVVEQRLGITPSGIADADIWKALLVLPPLPYPAPEKTQWIPFAQKLLPEIPTQWTYEEGYPQGAVIHSTAGRDNPIGTIEYLRRGGYPCLVIGRNGVIYQAFPLNRGGCHSGTYHHHSSVGIEIISAGRCTPVSIHGERRFAAWFHYDAQGNLRPPEESFPESEMRYVEENGPCREGWYQKYTPAQEEALIKLLLWLQSEAPQVFSFDQVKGHDECCEDVGRPHAKTDPGGALSMTMPELRELLRSKSIFA